jgi:DNA modification methylase
MPELKTNIIIQGDSLEVLKTLPDESVNCCITSPPYWGLRDYCIDGQLGLEKTPDEYVAKLVETFREVRRVLKKDGTLWLNLGDSYINNSIPGGGDPTIKKRNIGKSKYRANKANGIYKPKDICGIPWRVAFALQADGWYLRQDIIWHKPNPMPESVKDRCTKSHEYIFLLSKSAKYYFDHKVIKHKVASSTIGRGKVDFGGEKGRRYTPDKSDPNFRNGKEQWGRTFDYKNRCKNGVNKRSVWTIPTVPFKDAHFAVYPLALIEPCVLAGCPVNGVVIDPYFGSGTTGEVAVRAGRKFIGIELNKDYIKIADRRLKPYLDQKTIFDLINKTGKRL